MRIFSSVPSIAITTLLFKRFLNIIYAILLTKKTHIRNHMHESIYVNLYRSSLSFNNNYPCLRFHYNKPFFRCQRFHDDFLFDMQVCRAFISSDYLNDGFIFLLNHLHDHLIFSKRCLSSYHVISTCLLSAFSMMYSLH